MKQAEPFKPTFSLGERADEIERQEDGSFITTSSDGTKIHSQVICIAGGLGCFEPRKPAVEDLEKFEGKGITYMIKDPEMFRDKKVILAGGGDSALDWTMYLASIASELTLIHRNSSFRGAPDSADKVMALADQGKIKVLLNSNLTKVHGNGSLQEVSIVDKEKNTYQMETDYLVPLFGLSPKLGPLENWGLEIENGALIVNTKDFETNIPGIYAIGDINTYPGKLKLILSGFHEAALMSHGAYRRIFPDKVLNLKYTTVNGVQAF